MAFRFCLNESVADGVRRIAVQQIDRAIDELTDQQLDRHQAVHQTRKRCKKIRGLLRLVKPQLGDVFRQEDRWFRDVGRRLSLIRDAESVIEAFDRLVKRYDDQLDHENFKPIRKELAERRNHIAEEQVDLDERIGEVIVELRAARGRVSEWFVGDEDFAALAGGLKKTYARGRRAMRSAYHESTPENFHEWRKRAKYHWYHMRLLQNVWKPVMKGRCAAVKRLVDMLGNARDLTLFRRVIAETPDRFGEEEQVQAIFGLMARRHAELDAEARPLGERVFAEKPKRLVKRLRKYWRAWQLEKRDVPTLLT